MKRAGHRGCPALASLTAYQRPGTRQQVREARRSCGDESLLRAEQVPALENTIGISQLEVSQLVAVWV